MRTLCWLALIVAGARGDDSCQQVGTESELRTAVEAASQCILVSGRILIEEAILVSADTRIVGVDPESRLVGAGGSRLLDVSDGIALTLANLTLANGTAADDGGCARVGAGGSLTLTEVEMVDCVAGRSGGGVAADVRSTVILWHSSLRRATAERARGGGVFCNGSSTLVLEHSIVEDVSAGDDGGGLSVGEDSVVRVRDTVVRRAVAGGVGAYANGGFALLLSRSSLELDGETIVEDCAADFAGGAIYSSTDVTVVLRGRTSIRFSTASRGGGIYSMSRSSVTLRDSAEITDSFSDYWGGGVLVSENGTLALHDNARIHGGFALSPVYFDAWGGCVMAFADAKVVLTDDATVSECHADQLGGGIGASSNVLVTLNASATLANCSTDSALGSLGGCLYAGPDSVVVLEGSARVAGGSASSGGCVFGQRARMFVRGSTRIEHCQGDYGGAIVAVDAATLNVTESAVISSSVATVNGGGIQCHDGAALYFGDEARITSCHSGFFGGGLLFTENSTGIIDGGHIEDCSSTSGGGMSARAGTRVVFTGPATIARSYATSFGGCVEISLGGTLVATALKCLDSSSQHVGGGIYVGDDSTAELGTDVRVDGCFATDDGGGVAVRARASVVATGGEYVSNIAHRRGGGFFVFSTSRLVLQGVLVSENGAVFGGGLAGVAFSEIHVGHKTQFRSNFCTGDGGAVVLSDGVHSIVGDVLFEANVALQSGGAVMVTGSESSALLVSSSECAWTQVEDDFSSASASTAGHRRTVVAASTMETVDARGTSMVADFSNVAPGFVDESWYCLRPGNYVVIGASQSGGGWGGGLTTVTVLNIDGAKVRASCSVVSHACTAAFTVPEVVATSGTPRFLRNRAEKGAALVLQDQGRAFVFGAEFVENVAETQGGGAVFIDKLSGMDATDVVFAGNYAGSEGSGGVIYGGVLSTVSLVGVRASGNRADDSGGFGFFESATVHIEDSLLANNTAEQYGGAVLASEVERLDVVASTVANNSARVGAGLVVDVETQLRAVTFSANVAASTGGGLTVLGAGVDLAAGLACRQVRVVLDWRNTNQTCSVVNNGATCEGLAGECADLENQGLDCGGCACNAASFEVVVRGRENETALAGAAFSGALVAYEACLDAGEYVFRAYDERGASWFGGEATILVYEAGETPRRLMTTLGPIRVVGEKSEAVFFTLSASGRPTVFESNTAGVGGGALFVDAFGQGDVLPGGTLDEQSVVFVENRAPYGDRYASPARHLALAAKNDSVFSAESGQPMGTENGITVALTDSYSQPVTAFAQATAAVATLETSSGQTPGQVSGTEARFGESRGNATFESLVIIAQPGSLQHLTLETTATDLYTPSLEVDVRVESCVNGQYQDDTNRVCQNCEPDTYSFYPEDACDQCPDDALCESGLRFVENERGYWRSAHDSTNLRRCPFPEYCSQTQLWSDIDMPLHPDAQCDGNHAGPLCARCDSSSGTRRELDTSTGRCVRCDGGTRTRAVLLLLLVLVAVIAVGGLLCIWTSTYFSGSNVGSSASFISCRAGDLGAVVKILVVFYQVTSSLGRSFPYLRMPPLLLDYQRALSFINLDVLAILRRACLGRGLDYLDSLVLVTVIPVVVAALLALRALTTLHPSVSRRQLLEPPILVIAHLVLTPVSTVVVRTLQCDDDFDHRSEKLHSPFYGDSYLFADYEVSCQTDRYRAHRVYAIFMLFLYPIGIPLAFFIVLMKCKAMIAPSNVGALADHVLATSRREEDRISGLRTELAEKAQADYLTEYSRRWQDASLKATMRGFAQARRLAAQYRESAAKRTREADVALEKEKTAVIATALVETSREVEPSCRSTAFLWSDYSPGAWYYEIIESANRLALTCALPINGVDTNSYAQYVFGTLIALLFFAVYAWIQPISSRPVGLFASAVKLITLLNFFCLLILFTDQNMDDARTTGVKGKHVARVLVVFNAIVVPLLAVISIALDHAPDIPDFSPDEQQDCSPTSPSGSKKSIVSRNTSVLSDCDGSVALVHVQSYDEDGGEGKFPVDDDAADVVHYRIQQSGIDKDREDVSVVQDP